MAFHRIVEHLKAQNWTAVVIDLLIVVVGVYIGLQADSWNQARKDRSDARAYLERIHQDIERAERMSKRTRERRLGLIEGLEQPPTSCLSRAKRECLARTNASRSARPISKT